MIQNFTGFGLYDKAIIDICRQIDDPSSRPLAVEKAALELPQVTRWLEGRSPRKVIVVPNRIVNIVA